jgi:hypothetical protein
MAGRSREKYDRVFRIGKGCRSKLVTLNGDSIEKPFTVVYYNIERVSETSRAWKIISCLDGPFGVRNMTVRHLNPVQEIS